MYPRVLELELDPILSTTDASHRARVERSWDPRALRVVTYNIQFGKHMDCAREAFLSDPELRGADIVLLQEVDFNGVRDLAHALDYSYVYDGISHHPKAQNSWWGNAVLSPWPLTDAWHHELPGADVFSGTTRRAVGVVVKHPAGDVGAISLHAATVPMNFYRFRAQRRQWESAARRAIDFHRELNLKQTIVGGDFNSVGHKFLIPFPTVERLDAIFDEFDFIPMIETQTSTSEKHDVRLDHIYGAGVLSSASGVVRGLGCSDHQPVWAEVRRLRHPSE